MTDTRIQKETLESARSRFQLQIEKWGLGDGLPPSPDILKPLEDDGEMLPEKYCELLDLNDGSTYADAVEEFAPDDMYVLDLHGYPVRQAIELAEDTVKAAHEAGFGFVKLIHGAPDICHKMTADVLGRGGIKWELRGCLARGDWSKFVYPRRSMKHRIGDGEMILALRNGASANFGINKEVTK